MYVFAPGETVSTNTVIEVGNVPPELKLSVVFGPSNAYDVPAVKTCVLVIVPRIIPFPVLVLVMVTPLELVPIDPAAMERLTTWILLPRATFVVEELLFIVKLLKLVVPETVEFDGPAKTISDVVGVNVPLFIQLP